jgi:hypothetical protein
MRVLAALAALAAVVAVSAASAQMSSSGLRGIVMRGPISPVCAVEQRCDAPAKDVTLVFSRNGEVVRRTKTNDKGHYRVALVPGLYAVTLGQAQRQMQRISGGLEPTHVRVLANRFRRIDFSIDTGIR